MNLGSRCQKLWRKPWLWTRKMERAYGGRQYRRKMSAVKVAFKILDEDERPPIDSQYMKCHMVFSINLEEFSQRACLVAVIQFPPEMDENWVRYGLAKLGHISRLPNWQRMLFCAYTTQLLHSTGEVCWNNNDS